MRFRTGLLLLSILGLWAPAAHAATTQSQIDAARAKGLAWLLTRQRADGSWGSKAGTEVAATAFAVETLVKAGVKGRPFIAAVSWLSNAEPASTDSLARKAIALKGAGVTVTPHLDTLVAWRNRSLAWGAYTLFDSSFPDTALALGALRTAGYAYANYTTSACVILEARNKTTSPQDLTVYGSWGFGTTPPTSATAAAALPTVLNLWELDALLKAQLIGSSVSCTSGSQIIYDVKNDGVNWVLANRRHATDGGFGEPLNGSVVSTVLDTAAVYEVLKTFRPTASATQGALDYLVTHQQADGSWNGDPLQTAWVLRAILAAPGVDSDSDGLPDSVEAALRTNPSVPDSRGPPAGTGTNAPIALAPSRATAGGAAFTLTVTGSNFLATSTVQWNGANRTTTFVDANTLHASISAADIAIVGTAQVAVYTPSPGGGLSITLPFTISAIPLLSLAKAGTDVGTVTSSPAGIACGATCASLFPPGTQVTLTATPATGATFTGWSGGGCTGTAPCTLTLAADTLVTATFDPAPYTNWWNGRWQYRKPLTVPAGADPLEAGYSVGLQFSHAALVTAGQSSPAGDDVRITYFTGATEIELDRVLDQTAAWNSTTTKVWFKTQAAIAASGSDPNYYLYYGNPAAEAPPQDPNTVWALWDGFDDGVIDAAKWTVVSAPGVRVRALGGELRIDAPNDITLSDPNSLFGITSGPQFTGNFHVETTFRVSSHTSTAPSNWKATFGLGSGTNGLAVSSTASTDKRVQYYTGSAWQDVGDSGLSSTPSSNVQVRQYLTLDGTATHVDTLAPVSRTGVSTAARSLSFQYGPGIATAVRFDVRFDNLTVRKYVASDASVVVTPQTEQVAGGTRPTTTLGVRLPTSNTGTGTVTSSPPGIACGATCVAPFDTGTTITLTAAPGPAATVTWTGCSSVNGNTCTVTGLSVNKWIVATFSASQYVLSVTRAGTGSGTVTSNLGGIACGAACTSTPLSGSVQLTATADAGSLFAGWSGSTGCSGATNPLTLTMSAAKTCTATFNPVTASDIILDNGQAGTSSTGSWYFSSAPSPYGVNAAYAPPAATAATFTWTPTIPAAATYQVYVWWTSDTTRTNSVQYTITHAGGTATPTVDQTTGGGQWHSLGTFTFNAGTGGSVKVTGPSGSGSTPTVAADAVWFRYIPGGAPTLTITKTGSGTGTITSNPPGILCGTDCTGMFATGTPVTLTVTPDPGSTFAGWSGDGDCADGVAILTAARACTATFTGNDIVLDNGQPGTSALGTWGTSPAPNPYGLDSLTNGAAGTWYQWTPTLPAAGSYEVYLWWTEGADRSNAVLVRVGGLQGGGSQDFTVNQQQGGGQWHSLGIFTFPQGATGWVQVHGNGAGLVSADAVRFVPR